MWIVAPTGMRELTQSLRLAFAMLAALGRSLSEIRVFPDDHAVVIRRSCDQFSLLAPYP